MRAHRRTWLFALVALLLFGQLALAVHQSNLAAHAKGDMCEWCLAAAPLGAVLPSLALPTVPTSHIIIPTAILGAFLPLILVAYRGRGPPIYSA